MRWIDRLNRILVWTGGLSLLAMTIHVSLASLLRSIFGMGLDGTIEISSYYYMVAVSALPLGLLQAQRGHVIVEVFTKHLQMINQCRLDYLAGIVTAIYISVLVWGAALSAFESFRNGEYLKLHQFNLLIWPSRWIFLIGLLSILCTVLFQLGSGELLRKR